MERGGLGRSLTSILSGSYDSPADIVPAAASPSASAGLSLAYETLSLLVRSRQLRDAVVVVEDPALGRQLLVAGRRPLTANDEATVDGPPGCYTEPPSAISELELELVHRICAAALRCAALEPEPASPTDTVELALRRLPGVYGVALDEEDPIVEVYATGETEPDLARRVGSLARAHLEDVVTVDLVRRTRPSAPPPTVAEAPVLDELAALVESPVDAEPVVVAEPPVLVRPAIVDEGSNPSVVREAPELLRAWTLPGSATIEVQLQGADGLATGHAPRTRGLIGGVAATLEACRPSGLSAVWVRVTRTTVDGRCVAAVALRAGGSRHLRYGTGEGANPIEAAARATLHAITDPQDSPPASAEPV